MYSYIDKEKLINDIKQRGSNVVLNEWIDSAMELENNEQSIYQIKQLFMEFDESEKTISRTVAHLEMIFDKLLDINIGRFLTSQINIKK
jgi:hypothetical protein